jgi:hypothetical protein
MNVCQRITGGCVGLLCVGLLFAVTMPQAQAGDRVPRVWRGEESRSDAVRPGVPTSRRSLYAPPVFIDRITPISERPLAPPFTNRSPSIADRPLAPIGNAPGIAPDTKD